MKKLLVLIVLATASFTACTTATRSADPAKVEACKEKGKASGDTCKACCKEAGASGHMWTSGSGCKCL